MTKLTGLTASKGKAKGRIRHVKNLEDAEKVLENEIIVTDKITTEYTDAFIKCAGIISTKGGITSHAAILCRELKKPCIVSCTNAFEILKNGEVIEFDALSLEFNKV